MSESFDFKSLLSAPTAKFTPGTNPNSQYLILASKEDQKLSIRPFYDSGDSGVAACLRIRVDTTGSYFDAREVWGIPLTERSDAHSSLSLSFPLLGIGGTLLPENVLYFALKGADFPRHIANAFWDYLESRGAEYECEYDDLVMLLDEFLNMIEPDVYGFSSLWEFFNNG